MTRNGYQWFWAILFAVFLFNANAQTTADAWPSTPTIAGPSHGSTINLNSSVTVSWVQDGGVPGSSWKLLVDGVQQGATSTVISNSSNSNGTVRQTGSTAWTPDAAGVYRLRVDLCGNGTCTVGSTVSVQAVATPAAARIISLSAESNLNAGTTATVMWVQNGGSTATSWKFFVNQQQIGGTSFFITSTDSTQSGSVNWRPTDAGSYKLRIDLCNNLGLCTVGHELVIKVLGQVAAPPKAVLTAQRTSVQLKTPIQLSWSTALPGGATRWELWEDGNKLDQGNRFDSSTSGQAGSVTRTWNEVGTHAYFVRLCNTSACTDSNVSTVNVQALASEVVKLNSPVLQLAGNKVAVGNSLPYQWTIAGGGRPAEWRVYLDQQLLEKSLSFNANTLGWQSSGVLQNLSIGIHLLKIEVCNILGCQNSQQISFEVVANNSGLVAPQIRSLLPSSILKGASLDIRWDAQTSRAAYWRVLNGVQAITSNIAIPNIVDQYIQSDKTTIVFQQAGSYILSVEICAHNQICVQSKTYKISVLDANSSAINVAPPAAPLLSFQSLQYKPGDSVLLTWQSRGNRDSILTWELYNGSQLLQRSFFQDTPQVNYQGNIPFKIPGYGAYDFRLKVCNSASCVESNVASLAVVPAQSNVSVLKPGVPVISSLTPLRGRIGQLLEISWSMLNGASGKQWQLLQSGTGYVELSPIINIDDASALKTRLVYSVKFFDIGSKQLIVRLCNEAGCTDSSPYLITIEQEQVQSSNFTSNNLTSVVTSGTTNASTSTSVAASISSATNVSTQTSNTVTKADVLPSQVSVSNMNTIGSSGMSLSASVGLPSLVNVKTIAVTNPGKALNFNANPLNQNHSTGPLPTLPMSNPLPVVNSVASSSVSIDISQKANPAQTNSVVQAISFPVMNVQGVPSSADIPGIQSQGAQNSSKPNSVSEEDPIALNRAILPTVGGISRVQTSQTSGLIPTDLAFADRFQASRERFKNTSGLEFKRNQAPGKAVISIPRSNDNTVFSTSRSLLINWSRWEGEAASTWSLMVNGNIIMSAPLSDQSVQAGQGTFARLNVGTNMIFVQLCNMYGCSMSDPWIIQAQSTGIDRQNIQPDVPTILPISNWSFDVVSISWRSGKRPGKSAQVLINGAPVGEKLFLQENLNQSVTQKVLFPKNPLLPQIMVSILLCNDVGCTVSQSLSLKSL